LIFINPSIHPFIPSSKKRKSDLFEEFGMIKEEGVYLQGEAQSLLFCYFLHFIAHMELVLDCSQFAMNICG